MQIRLLRLPVDILQGGAETPTSDPVPHVRERPDWKRIALVVAKGLFLIVYYIVAAAAIVTFFAVFGLVYLIVAAVGAAGS